MYDKVLIIEILEQIEKTIENLLESTANIESTDELTGSADGILRLNGI